MAAGIDRAWRALRAFAEGRGAAPSVEGSWDDAARAMLRALLPVAASPDLVVGQLGQTLDGHIATASRASEGLNGAANIVHLHRLRALVDVVVVGAGTVAADDPRLTVRRVEGASPARAVIDPRGRARDGRVFQVDGCRRLRIGSKGEGPQREGVEPCPVEGDGDLPPGAIVAALRARGFRRILVEGGGDTVTRFLRAGCLERLHLCVAPKLFGSGVRGLVPPLRATPSSVTVHRLGEDVLYDLAWKKRPGAGPENGDGRSSRPG
jgi:diaminohydroxyphosphoribosylaminopyrimidine deaminase/5-amino-6-(5-phosphoribosylamino)uracil reductase